MQVAQANSKEHLSAQEMASDEVRRQIDQMRRDALDKSRMTFSGGTLASEIKCKKCGKTNVTYNQVCTSVLRKLCNTALRYYLVGFSSVRSLQRLQLLCRAVRTHSRSQYAVGSRMFAFASSTSYLSPL